MVFFPPVIRLQVAPGAQLSSVRRKQAAMVLSVPLISKLPTLNYPAAGPVLACWRKPVGNRRWVVGSGKASGHKNIHFPRPAPSGQSQTPPCLQRQVISLVIEPLCPVPEKIPLGRGLPAGKMTHRKSLLKMASPPDRLVTSLVSIHRHGILPAPPGLARTTEGGQPAQKNQRANALSVVDRTVLRIWGCSRPAAPSASVAPVRAMMASCMAGD